MASKNQGVVVRGTRRPDGSRRKDRLIKNGYDSDEKYVIPVKRVGGSKSKADKEIPVKRDGGSKADKEIPVSNYVIEMEGRKEVVQDGLPKTEAFIWTFQPKPITPRSEEPEKEKTDEKPLQEKNSPKTSSNITTTTQVVEVRPPTHPPGRTNEDRPPTHPPVRSNEVTMEKSKIMPKMPMEVPKLLSEIPAVSSAHQSSQQDMGKNSHLQEDKTTVREQEAITSEQEMGGKQERACAEVRSGVTKEKGTPDDEDCIVVADDKSKDKDRVDVDDSNINFLQEESFPASIFLQEPINCDPKLAIDIQNVNLELKTMLLMIEHGLVRTNEEKVQMWNHFVNSNLSIHDRIRSCK